MPLLTAKQEQQQASHILLEAGRVAGGNTLRQRLALKFAPIFKRLDAWEKLLPRSIDFAALLLFLLLLFFYLAFSLGIAQRFCNYLINGFAQIEEIKISGHKRSTQEEILKALNLDPERHMASLNVEEARRYLLSLPWIKNVSIQKLYPHRVLVQIEERTPYAIWQDGGEKTIIDLEGKPLYPMAEGDTAFQKTAPVIMGKGANLVAKDFVALCQRMADTSQTPAVQSFFNEIAAYSWVDHRRWDILLTNGIKISLPEQNAFSRLEAFLHDPKQIALLNQDIKRIDLRLDGSITVELSPSFAKLLEDEANFLKKQRLRQESQIKGGFL